MQVRTRHTPAFGVARLMLGPDEAAAVELDTLVASSFGVRIEPRGRGGLRGRSRSGQAVVTAPADGGWVDVAPALPGEVSTLDLDLGAGWCVTRGALLARSATIRADPAWAGFHPLFGTEPGFLEHLSGTGAVVLACCGALDVISLEPGELVSVDPAYVLAYPQEIQMRLRAVDPSLPQSVRTGAGLMLDFAGPGGVLTQTRNARTLAASLTASGG